MKIRRKDNQSKVMLLPKSAIRTGQGWLVPILSEFPDDLFVTYLDQDWEPVAQGRELPRKVPSRSPQFFDKYFGMASQN